MERPVDADPSRAGNARAAQPASEHPGALDGPVGRSGSLLGISRAGQEAQGGARPAPGKTAAGDRDVHDPGNATKTGRRGAGVQRRSGEVARVPGTQEAQGDPEGTLVILDLTI